MSTLPSLTKRYSLFLKKTFSSGDDGFSQSCLYFFLTDYPSSPVTVEYFGHFQYVNRFHSDGKHDEQVC